MIYQHGSVSYAVSFRSLRDGVARVTIGDREITVAAREIEGGWLLTLDGQQMRLYTAARGNERYVSAAGETYTLIVPEPGRRRAASIGRGDLTAQMPGQVREVFVKEGDAVTSGQALLLLEAMKMEIRVNAPADGRVKRLLVRTGDVVDRGQRLAELEWDFRE